jgi:hypothetical protein
MVIQTAGRAFVRSDKVIEAPLPEILFVGPGLRQRKARALSKGGEITQISRGIYIRTDTDQDVVEHQYAAAMVAYRYPDATFMGSSAARWADGRSPSALHGIFLYSRVARRRVQMIGRTRITIFPYPDSPLFDQKAAPACLGLDTTYLYLSSPEQILADALRFPEACPDDEDLYAILRHGTAAPTGAPTWLTFLRHQPDHLELTAFVKKGLALMEISNQKVGVRAFPLHFHEEKIGRLEYDGLHWRFRAEGHWLLPIQAATSRPGRDDPFFASLMPEGWGEDREDQRSMANLAAFLSRSPRRLMNISAGWQDNAPPPNNLIDARSALWNWKDTSARFNGWLEDPRLIDAPYAGSALDRDCTAPRLSGVQAKAPAYLQDGRLVFADANTPFTVIAKFDKEPDNRFEGVVTMEWAGQNAARHAGIAVPESALIDRAGQQRVLLSERFDARRWDDPTPMWRLAHDFAALIDLPGDRKYETSMEKIAATLKDLSTNWLEDGTALFKRTAAAWAMCDGDMHAKNLSIIKTSYTGEKWDSVSLSPAYDTVPTRVFELINDDEMALTIDGQHSNMTKETWKYFGKLCGLKQPLDVLSQVSGDVAGAFESIANETTAWSSNTAAENRLLEKAVALTRKRALEVGAVITVPDFEDLMCAPGGQSVSLMMP